MDGAWVGYFFHTEASFSAFVNPNVVYRSTTLVMRLIYRYINLYKLDSFKGIKMVVFGMPYVRSGECRCALYCTVLYIHSEHVYSSYLVLCIFLFIVKN